MDKGELEYRKEMLRWYLNEGKRQLSELPLWIRGLIAGLASLVVVFMLLMVWQAVKPEPQPEGPPPVVVDTTPAAVPDLHLMDRLVAEKKLADMGFSTVRVEIVKEYASSDSDFIVIKQSPTPGTVIRKNEDVTLYYGSKALYEKGQKQVEMPSVVGLTRTNAIAALKKAGFVKIAADLPEGMDDARAIVSAQSPVKGATATLNDDVTLTLTAGFQWDEVEAKLKTDFQPYKTFSKVEPLKGEDIQLTLAQKDPALTTEPLLSERARSYKIGMEQVLGRTIGNVVLIIPGIDVTGESAKAAKRVTDKGLSVAAAQDFCGRQAEVQHLKLDWEKRTLSAEVTADQINLTTVGISERNGLESVVTCNVAGTPDKPVLVKISVQ